MHTNQSGIFSYKIISQDLELVTQMLKTKQNSFDSDSDSDDDSAGKLFNLDCNLVTQESQQIIIDRLKIKKALLLFPHVDINRQVEYISYDRKSKNHEYNKIQPVLAHLFALRCWSVIEYIITSDIAKIDPGYVVDDLNNEKCSVSKILWRENKKLLHLLMKKPYFKIDGLRSDEDSNVIKHIQNRLLFIAKAQTEKIIDPSSSSIFKGFCKQTMARLQALERLSKDPKHARYDDSGSKTLKQG